VEKSNLIHRTILHVIVTYEQPIRYKISKKIGASRKTDPFILFA
jgi:hypothetical protein